MILFRLLVILVALVGLARPTPLARDAATPEPPPKRIALSFDDVPRGAGAFLPLAERPGRLIAALRDADVEQAVFFVNPARIRAGDPLTDYAGAYARAGHVLADHTYSHPHLSSVSADFYLADIDKAEAWLRDRPGYRPWLRFPFLDEGGPDKAKRDAVREGLKARGIRHGYATVDGSDWNLEQQTLLAKRAGRPMDMAALRDLYVETHVQSADFADAVARRALGRSPAHMLLLHETDLAALFIGDLVAALRADGWDIITADAAYADPMARHLPEVAWAAGTMVEMIAWEKKLPPPRWYDRNDEAVANRLFAARVLGTAPN